MISGAESPNHWTTSSAVAEKGKPRIFRTPVCGCSGAAGLSRQSDLPGLSSESASMRSLSLGSAATTRFAMHLTCGGTGKHYTALKRVRHLKALWIIKQEGSTVKTAGTQRIQKATAPNFVLLKHDPQGGGVGQMQLKQRLQSFIMQTHSNALFLPTASQCLASLLLLTALP